MPKFSQRLYDELVAIGRQDAADAYQLNMTFGLCQMNEWKNQHVIDGIHAMRWSTTPQGFDYWSRVASELTNAKSRIPSKPIDDDS